MEEKNNQTRLTNAEQKKRTHTSSNQNHSYSKKAPQEHSPYSNPLHKKTKLDHTDGKTNVKDFLTIFDQFLPKNTAPRFKNLAVEAKKQIQSVLDLWNFTNHFAKIIDSHKKHHLEEIISIINHVILDNLKNVSVELKKHLFLAQTTEPAEYQNLDKIRLACKDTSLVIKKIGEFSRKRIIKTLEEQHILDLITLIDLFYKLSPNAKSHCNFILGLSQISYRVSKKYETQYASLFLDSFKYTLSLNFEEEITATVPVVALGYLADAKKLKPLSLSQQDTLFITIATLLNSTPDGSNILIKYNKSVNFLNIKPSLRISGQGVSDCLLAISHLANAGCLKYIGIFELEIFVWLLQQYKLFNWIEHGKALKALSALMSNKHLDILKLQQHSQRFDDFSKIILDYFHEIYSIVQSSINSVSSTADTDQAGRTISSLLFHGIGCSSKVDFNLIPNEKLLHEIVFSFLDLLKNHNDPLSISLSLLGGIAYPARSQWFTFFNDKEFELILALISKIKSNPDELSKAFLTLSYAANSGLFNPMEGQNYQHRNHLLNTLLVELVNSTNSFCRPETPISDELKDRIINNLLLFAVGHLAKNNLINKKSFTNNKLQDTCFLLMTRLSKAASAQAITRALLGAMGYPAKSQLLRPLHADELDTVLGLISQLTDFPVRSISNTALAIGYASEAKLLTILQNSNHEVLRLKFQSTVFYLLNRFIDEIKQSNGVDEPLDSSNLYEPGEEEDGQENLAQHISNFLFFSIGYPAKQGILEKTILDPKTLKQKIFFLLQTLKSLNANSQAISNSILGGIGFTAKSNLLAPLSESDITLIIALLADYNHMESQSTSNILLSIGYAAMSLKLDILRDPDTVRLVGIQYQLNQTVVNLTKHLLQLIKSQSSSITISDSPTVAINDQHINNATLTIGYLFKSNLVTDHFSKEFATLMIELSELLSAKPTEHSIGTIILSLGYAAREGAIKSLSKNFLQNIINRLHQTKMELLPEIRLVLIGLRHLAKYKIFSNIEGEELFQKWLSETYRLLQIIYSEKSETEHLEATHHNVFMHNQSGIILDLYQEGLLKLCPHQDIIRWLNLITQSFANTKNDYTSGEMANFILDIAKFPSFIADAIQINPNDILNLFLSFHYNYSRVEETHRRHITIKIIYGLGKIQYNNPKLTSVYNNSEFQKVFLKQLGMLNGYQILPHHAIMVTFGLFMAIAAGFLVEKRTVQFYFDIVLEYMYDIDPIELIALLKPLASLSPKILKAYFPNPRDLSILCIYCNKTSKSIEAPDCARHLEILESYSLTNTDANIDITENKVQQPIQDNNLNNKFLTKKDVICRENQSEKYDLSTPKGNSQLQKKFATENIEFIPSTEKLPCLLAEKVFEIGGLGLFAGESITAGTYLGTYIGEHKPLSTSDNNSMYGMETADSIIDADKIRGHTALANHSYACNVIVKELYNPKTKKFEPRFYALRDIAPGEQIFISYGKHFFNNLANPFTPYFLHFSNNSQSPDEKYSKTKNDYELLSITSSHQQLLKTLGFDPKTKYLLVSKLAHLLINHNGTLAIENLSSDYFSKNELLIYSLYEQNNKLSFCETHQQQYINDLMLACYYGHAPLIKRLLDSDIYDLNRQTLVNGDTALGFVISGLGSKHAKEEIIKLLMDSQYKGLYFHLVNRDGQGIFEYAINHGDTSVLMTLMQQCSTITKRELAKQFYETAKPSAFIKLLCKLPKENSDHFTFITETIKYCTQKLLASSIEDGLIPIGKLVAQNDLSGLIHIFEPLLTKSKVYKKEKSVLYLLGIFMRNYNADNAESVNKLLIILFKLISTERSFGRILLKGLTLLLDTNQAIAAEFVDFLLYQVRAYKNPTLLVDIGLKVQQHKIDSVQKNKILSNLYEAYKTTNTNNKKLPEPFRDLPITASSSQPNLNNTQSSESFWSNTNKNHGKPSTSAKTAITKIEQSLIKTDKSLKDKTQAPTQDISLNNKPAV